jgi:hypothetical protein
MGNKVVDPELIPLEQNVLYVHPYLACALPALTQVITGSNERAMNLRRGEENPR